MSTPLQAGERLAGILSQIGVLYRELSFLHQEVFRLMQDLFPAAPASAGPQTPQEVEEMWRKAMAERSGPPGEEIRRRVMEQMQKANSLAEEQNRLNGQVAEAVHSPTAAAVNHQTATASSLPGPSADIMDKVRFLAGVLGVNGITLGVNDPGAVQPVFYLLDHKVTHDVYELFNDILGAGRFVLNGSNDPNAPPSDLRKRPDLVGGVPPPPAAPAFGPIPSGVMIVPPEYNKGGPPYDRVPAPSNIPPTFDGATGLRSPTARVSNERIPNAADAKQE